MMGTITITKPRPWVALVTINRPEVRNAINRDVAVELAEAVARIEDDDATRVAILTGSGQQAFCAGGDLKDAAENSLEPLFIGDAGLCGFTEVARRKPWIAAINGAALAGGCELALACDLIVAAEHATFGLPEVARGLIAGAGGSYKLAQLIPPKVAIELVLTGAPITAKRAFDCGLANRVVSLVRLLPETFQLAETIAANAPLAVRESLQIARDAVTGDQLDLRRRSEDALRRISKTKDFGEGLAAFAAKRSANWEGR